MYLDIHGRYIGKWVTQRGGLEFGLKSSAKNKERRVWGKPIMEKWQGKQVQGLLYRFTSLPSPFIRFSCDLEASSFWYREEDTLTNEDLLYKYKVPLQNVTSIIFRASHVSPISPNN